MRVRVNGCMCKYVCVCEVVGQKKKGVSSKISIGARMAKFKNEMRWARDVPCVQRPFVLAKFTYLIQTKLESNRASR